MIGTRTDFHKRVFTLRFAVMCSVVIAVLITILHLAAYVMTNSTSVLGALFDSTLDCILSLINLFAMRYALRPPDINHTFGHGKVEPIVGLLQVFLIIDSAILIAVISFIHIRNGYVLDNGFVPIVTSFLAILLNMVILYTQKKVLQHTDSLFIRSDFAHYQGDFLINVSVIISMILTYVVGIKNFDAYCGFFISVFMVWNVVRIIKNSFNQLMDRGLGQDRRLKIKYIIESDSETLGVHNIYTRCSGMYIFIQFHLELDPYMNLIDAHKVAVRVEKAVQLAFPNAYITIHQDPKGYGDDHDHYRPVV